jgi:hypothetical protein
MQEQEQSEQQGGKGNGVGFNFVVLVLRSIAVTVEVFLHRRFGSRYVGLQGALGIIMILLFAAIIPAPGTWGLILFLFAYLKACLYARAGVLWRKLHGQEFDHTLYSGMPYLMKVLPRWNELTVKRFVEPALVFLVGCAVAHFIPALALYLFMAAGALFMTVNQAEANERRRAETMRDSMIEAQQRAERVRSMWNHRN